MPRRQSPQSQSDKTGPTHASMVAAARHSQQQNREKAIAHFGGAAVLEVGRNAVRPYATDIAAKEAAQKMVEKTEQFRSLLQKRELTDGYEFTADERQFLDDFKVEMQMKEKEADRKKKWCRSFQRRRSPGSQIFCTVHPPVQCNWRGFE